MANTKFYIKQNDTGPAISAVLTNALGGVVSLAGASGVEFHMTNAAGVVKVNGAGTIDDAVNGIVSYDWQAGDTDTVGTFNAEFQVDFGGGLIETFPNDRNLQVVITKELA